jgi:hypothetical protein
VFDPSLATFQQIAQCAKRLHFVHVRSIRSTPRLDMIRVPTLFQCYAAQTTTTTGAQVQRGAQSFAA